MVRSNSWVVDIGNVSGAVIGFAIARFILGLGEACNFPAAIKAVAEWFPVKERALATGIIGATIAPFEVGFVPLPAWLAVGLPCNQRFATIWLILCLPATGHLRKTSMSPPPSSPTSTAILPSPQRR
jgi:MFS family permease